MANKYLGKDTEHVFEVQQLDTSTGATGPVWFPALRCEIDGEEKLVHAAQSTWGPTVWVSSPELVRIEDIAHMLTPAQYADMKRP